MPLVYLLFALAVPAALVVATLVAGAIGRAGFPLPPDDRRLGCVDGLRGYLALSVMTYHFFLWTQTTRLGGGWTPPAINPVAQLGAGAVALFFMTTGLVFYPRVLGGFAAASWRGIAVTRLFRIVPLVAASVAAITVVIMLRTGALPDRGYPFAAATWISTWDEPPLLGYAGSALMNAKVLWSLWYEWLFYLFVLPTAAAAMDLVRARGRASWLVPVGLLAVAILGRVATKAMGYSFDLLRYLPLFAVGMLAYEVQSRPRLRVLLARRAVAPVAAGALAIGMIASPSPYTVSLPLFGLFFVCVACGNDLGGVLRLRGALVLGECSFGIYLLHGLLLDILFVDAGALHQRLSVPASMALLPLAALAIVPVVAASYLGIERPAIRAGKAIARRWTGRRPRLDSRELEVAP